MHIARQASINNRKVEVKRKLVKALNRKYTEGEMIEKVEIYLKNKKKRTNNNNN